MITSGRLRLMACPGAGARARARARARVFGNPFCFLMRISVCKRPQFWLLLICDAYGKIKQLGIRLDDVFSGAVCGCAHEIWDSN